MRALEALDPEQRAVAEALEGPVCVLAGAGTGKTRAITHRIAHGVHVGAFAPQHVLAVTFTTRAAGEMRGRLRTLGVEGVQARTFHSAALRQARFFWPTAVGRELPPIVDRKLPLVREAAGRCRVPTDPALVRDLASEIEWAKVSNVAPDAYAAAAETARRDVGGAAPEVVARVYAAYERVREQRDVIDLEDVLLAGVSLLDAHPAVAERVRASYRHFVVDEYQDVSPLQQRLLELWLGDRDDVCVVGDPHQTIYSFAGARPDYLLRFPERHPSATVVRLVRDYRSTPQVVAVANRVLDGATGVTAAARLVLQAQRPDGPAPTFTEHPDELAEAAAVARGVQRLLAAGTPAREVAVLFRVNAQSEAYEQALAELGIPTVLRGAERFFDRAEVRQAALLLRGAARAPAGASLGDAVRAVLGGLGWTPEPPASSAGSATRERWESLAALVGLAEEVAAARPEATLSDLVGELDHRAALQHAPTADGVTLASLHSTKGLEWDAVFVVGCQEGTVPIAHAETPAEVEEERRLLYVGVTRARTHLAVSWALARSPGGRSQRPPSRFLDGLLGRSAPRAGGPAGRNGRRVAALARCHVCGVALRAAAERKLGRCEGCPADVDEELFERLRAWRLAESKEQGVPAYVVFTDATLRAIAETRPADDRALAAVPGVGATKLARYGEAVVGLCAGGS